jgi:hypothetical protein
MSFLFAAETSDLRIFFLPSEHTIAYLISSASVISPNKFDKMKKTSLFGFGTSRKFSNISRIGLM